MILDSTIDKIIATPPKAQAAFLAGQRPERRTLLKNLIERRKRDRNMGVVSKDGIVAGMVPIGDMERIAAKYRFDIRSISSISRVFTTDEIMTVARVTEKTEEKGCSLVRATARKVMEALVKEGFLFKGISDGVIVFGRNEKELDAACGPVRDGNNLKKIEAAIRKRKRFTAANIAEAAAVTISVAQKELRNMTKYGLLVREKDGVRYVYRLNK